MKLLILTSRFPYPIEKGDKLRAFYQIKGLSQRHKLTLVSLCEEAPTTEELAVVKTYCQGVHCLPLSKAQLPFRLLRGWLTGLPLQVSWFYDSKLKAEIHQIISRENPDLIFCQLLRPAQYLADIKRPMAIDYMDCFSLGMRRRARGAPLLSRPVWKMESRRLAAYEARIFDWFAAHTIISAQDRDQLPVARPDRVQVVPNGVDTHFFTPEETPAGREVIFVGNMGYAPNIEAARVLAEEVMPLVWAKNPEINLVLAGARPAASIRSLASHPQIEVTGFLSDIRQAYKRGMVLAAPLQSGSGQQNKILEGMSMGIPCLTTSLVNNAIGAEPGKSILIADEPEEMARQVLALSADPKQQEILRREGRAFVCKRYSWETAVNGLEEAWAIPELDQ